MYHHTHKIIFYSAFSVLILTGCQQQADNKVSSTPSPDTSAVAVQPKETEKFSVFLVQKLDSTELNIHNQVGNEKAENFAKLACAEFDKGTSIQDTTRQTLQGLQNIGATEEALQKFTRYSDKLINTGVASFCPEHQDKLQVATKTENIRDNKFAEVLNKALDINELNFHKYIGIEKAEQFAKSSCQGFDQGRSFTELVTLLQQEMQTNGFQGQQLALMSQYSGKVIGVGIATFCPQHLKIITQEAEQLGNTTTTNPTIQPQKFSLILRKVLDSNELKLHNTIGDAKALITAKSVCQNFEQGYTFEDVLKNAVTTIPSNEAKPEEVKLLGTYLGKVTGVGVVSFCPEYRDRLKI
jgi:hypothetical protein